MRVIVKTNPKPQIRPFHLIAHIPDTIVSGALPKKEDPA